jgi:hypothetical protein
MSQFFVGVSSGNLPPEVATQFTTDDAAQVIPIANNVNVFGGTGISTTGNVGTGTITINVKNEGFAWSEKTADFLADIENGYFCNNALTVTLPPSGSLAIGNTVVIYVDTTQTVIIQAGAGELIQVGSNISVAGGTASSSTRGATLLLVYKPSDLTWHTASSLGVWGVA